MYALKLVSCLLLINSYFCIGEKESSQGDNLNKMAIEYRQTGEEMAQGVGKMIQLTQPQTRLLREVWGFWGQSCGQTMAIACQMQSENFNDKYDRYKKIGLAVCDKLVPGLMDLSIMELFGAGQLAKTMVPTLCYSLVELSVNFIENLAKQANQGKSTN